MLNEKNKDIVKNGYMELGDNVIKYKNSVIQMSNISYYSIDPMPKKPYPLWAFGGIGAGALTMLTNNEMITMVGIIFLLICTLYLYTIYADNSALGQYLLLHLNCGKIVLFSSKDEKFLSDAEDAITECFKNGNIKYNINFKDCKISSSEGGSNMININSTGNFAGRDISGPIVMGDSKNSVVGENNGSVIVNSYTEEWNELEQAFKSLETVMSRDSLENRLILQALFQIQHKDKQGFKKVLENNKEEFKNKIFCHLTTAGITEIIKKITGLDF